MKNNTFISSNIANRSLNLSKGWYIEFGGKLADQVLDQHGTRQYYVCWSPEKGIFSVPVQSVDETQEERIAVLQNQMNAIQSELWSLVCNRPEEQEACITMCALTSGVDITIVRSIYEKFPVGSWCDRKELIHAMIMNTLEVK